MVSAVRCSRLRPLLFVFFCVLVALIHAQGALTPLWSSAGWHQLQNPPQYSPDGTRILVWQNPSNPSYGQNDSITVYNAASGTIAAHLIVDGQNGNLTSACLSANGSAIFYATDQGNAFDYNIATRTQTAFKISEGSGNGPVLLTASGDGKSLVYVVNDPLNGDNLVCVYNLGTNTFLKRFDFVNPGTQTTSSIGFIDKNQELVLSGPTVYTLQGALVKGVVNSNEPVAISPDGTRLFTYNSNDSDYHAYTSSNLKQIWQNAGPSGGTQNVAPALSILCVSSDGKSVLFGGYDSTDWYVDSMSAATGQQLGSFIKSRTLNVANSPYLVASPVTNQILVGPDAINTFAQLWDYNPSTGAGTLVGSFFEGVSVATDDLTPLLSNAPVFSPCQVTISGNAIPCVSVLSYEYGTEFCIVRSTKTGQAVALLPAGTYCVPSLDGKYFAYQAQGKLYVNRLSDGSNIANISEATPITTIQWGAGDRLALGTGGYGIYIVSFNGTTLSNVHAFNGSSANYVFSADGTKLAMAPFFTGDPVTLYNPTTGAETYSINQDTNSFTGIDDASFSNNNRLCLHEVLNGSGGSYVAECRVFDISKSTPKLLSTIRVPMSDANSAQYADGMISPDGNLVVMGHPGPSSASDPRKSGVVTLYNAISGAVVATWTSQSVPDFAPVGANQGANALTHTFGFSSDSSVLLWASSAALVALPTATSSLSVTVAPQSVGGGASLTGKITVSPPATTATAVSLLASSKSCAVPSSVTIPANASSVTFTIKTIGVASVTNVTLDASSSKASGKAEFTITPVTQLGLSFSPSTVPGGNTTTGTLRLNAAAGPSGLVVKLASSNPVLSVPSSVTVSANRSEVTFTAKSSQPSSTVAVTVEAALGSLRAASKVTVERTASLLASFDVTSVTGGNAVLLTISLSAPAPAGGLALKLSSNSSALQAPTSLVVPAGRVSYVTGVSTLPVLGGTTAALTIKSSSNQSATAVEKIVPPVLQSISAPVTRLVGGASTYAELQLSGPAPAGLAFACSSSSAALTIRTPFAFPAGHAVADLSITTKPVSQVTTVTVTIGGKSLVLTLIP